MLNGSLAIANADIYSLHSDGETLMQALLKVCVPVERQAYNGPVNEFVSMASAGATEQLLDWSLMLTATAAMTLGWRPAAPPRGWVERGGGRAWVRTSGPA
ncbi:MAG: hypothetical protein EBR82_51080 [Caulobacteraceae bacterium]|nr:hypothetical protein [Caulobacteraceae bacterium]